jgi:aspartate kinase
LKADSSGAASKLIVQKYGGTSVGSIERIKHIAGHIANTVNQGHQVVAVISAMGDQTDELLAMAHSISSNPPRRELDMLLTAGERVSMALVSIALNDLGQSAFSLTGSQSGIITDTVHGNARISSVKAHRIQDILAKKNIAIVAGFQGVSADTKEITTLGRGGSDLSAIALAASLGAERCQLYKDVDGVCSADPRVVAEAKVIETLGWNSMTEMAWAGASVLHPRGAHLAAKFKIPIEIRSSFNLTHAGTFVSGEDVMEQLVIHAVIQKLDMSLLRGTISQNDLPRLDELRFWLWQQGESPQIQLQIARADEIEFCYTVPRVFVDQARQKLQGHASTKNAIETVECGIVSIIGSGFWQSPETLEKVRRIIPDSLFLDVKNNCVTLALKVDGVEPAIRNLHNCLLQ